MTHLSHDSKRRKPNSPAVEKSEGLVQRRLNSEKLTIGRPQTSQVGLPHRAVQPQAVTEVAANNSAPTIQAKLMIGQPGDKYEQEADRVAAQVMRMPDPQAAAAPSQSRSSLPLATVISWHPSIISKTEDSGLETVKTEAQITPTKAQVKQTPQMNPSLEARLQSTQGQGQPLSDDVQSFMESRFGYDFSQVCMHTDHAASELNNELNAQAFTYQQDIYFRAGSYLPTSSSGRQLLAHELTHVIQQSTPTRSNTLSRKELSTNGKLEPDYRDNSQDLLKEGLSLFGLFQLYMINQDDIVIQHHGKTMRYTREWLHSDIGLAILRGEIRYKIALALYENEGVDLPADVDMQSHPDRRSELESDLRRAKERRNEEKSARSSISIVDVSTSLVEVGKQGRTMSSRGPARKLPDESENEYLARSAKIKGKIHAAMDVPGGKKSNQGAGVYAPIAGKIVHAGPGDRWGSGYGNVVRIYHSTPPATNVGGTQPLYTHYAHLDQVLVKTGDNVHPGEAIGTVGSTRENAQRSAGQVPPNMGAHLHFGVELAGSEESPGSRVQFSSSSEVKMGINPACWLRELGVKISESTYKSAECRGEKPSKKKLQFQKANVNSSASMQLQLQKDEPTTKDMEDIKFMGKDVKVSSKMKGKLKEVEKHLEKQTDFDSIKEQIKTINGFSDRGTTSKHNKGDAIDVNYKDQPYIPTRTFNKGKPSYGGESAAEKLGLRKPAVEVFDRAVKFVYPGLNRGADISARKPPKESTAGVYDRFKETSDALSIYLSLAIKKDHEEIVRRGDKDKIKSIEDIEKIEKIEETIPSNERLDRGEAIEKIKDFIEDKENELYGRLDLRWFYSGDKPIFCQTWQASQDQQDKPGYSDIDIPDFYPSTSTCLEKYQADSEVYIETWKKEHFPLTPEEQYIRILKDYEIVRRSMQKGNPSLNPEETRNPARGFLDMPKDFVVAMVDVGKLRWGACDLGPKESGDIHHFDIR